MRGQSRAPSSGPGTAREPRSHADPTDGGHEELLRADWRLDGIGVTSVHPGAIKTDMIQATLADSDDVKIAQRNYEMAQRTGVTPDHAARLIVDAVKKDKLRVRIGRDSLLLDWLKRLAPSAIHEPMVRVAKQLAPRPDGTS